VQKELAQRFDSRDRKRRKPVILFWFVAASLHFQPVSDAWSTASSSSSVSQREITSLSSSLIALEVAMCGFEGPFDPFSTAITAVRAAAAWFNSLDGQPNQRPAKMHGVTGKDIDSPA
jgi:hypothetical protein